MFTNNPNEMLIIVVIINVFKDKTKHRTNGTLIGIFNGTVPNQDIEPNRFFNMKQLIKA